MEDYYNERTHDRPDFVSGQHVCYRDSPADKVWKRGKIIAPRSDNGRSYVLMSENGNQILRNKRLMIADDTKQPFAVTTELVSPHVSAGTEPIPSAGHIPPQADVPASAVDSPDNVEPEFVNEPSPTSANSPPPPAPRKSERARKHKPSCKLPCCS